MVRYLVVLIWPVGLAVIAGAAFLLARRQSGALALAGAEQPGPAGARQRSHKAAGPGADLSEASWDTVRFVTLAVVGALVVFGLMCALGVLVVNHGLTVDHPIFTWMRGHQVHAMAALMNRLTKIGDTWTTWGAAFAAAACLTVASKSKRWLPIIVVITVIVGDHYTTLALRHVFHRLGPPTSPLGTFPSGGCDRVIVFYGLIGYLLWREFSGRRSTAIGVGAAVAALGFNEAYSRVYLSLHWTTDALSGLLYGALLLTVFIAGIHVVAGRPAVRGADNSAATSAPAADPGAQVPPLSTGTAVYET